MRIISSKQRSIFTLLGAFFFLVSGFAEVEIGRVFGSAGRALWALEDAESSEAKNWNWFSSPASRSTTAVSSRSCKADAECYTEEAAETEKPANAFELALAKMNKIRSNRSQRDKELLAELQQSDRSQVLREMADKFRELSERAERADKCNGKRRIVFREAENIEAPVVPPVFVSGPTSVTIKVNENNSQKNDNIIEDCKNKKCNAQCIEKESCRSKEEIVPFVSAPVKSEQAKDVFTEAEMTFASTDMTEKRMEECDEQEVACEVPPVVYSKTSAPSASSVSSVDSSFRNLPNRYAVEIPEHIEILYVGLGTAYSARINELVNARKDKIFN